MSTQATTDAGMDHANAQLEHAAEIDAAVKFVLWLQGFGHVPTGYKPDGLRALAAECFCGE